MPKTRFEIVKSRHPEELNEAQQRQLAATCKSIDDLLCSIEHTLHSAASLSPFPRFLADVTSAQARVLEDHIRQVRSRLLRALDWQELKPEPPEIPVTHAIAKDLALIDITIDELKPSYIRGSGTVSDQAEDELRGVVCDLHSLIRSMDGYIRQEFGTNLDVRLRKLEETGLDIALLRLIESMATRHGLVELRPRLDLLTSRLEDVNLEVAFLGRVSSGKSSLLNALLSTNVLPAGINPITAVPTRLTYGPALRAKIVYASGSEEIVTVEELSRLVTEQGNPGNLRNIVRAAVEMPAPRLKQDVVLVDTPGLGSLARSGAAQTLAYLPSCDLAVFLIDAGTALNDEDIGTLRLLYEAGIPAIVVLSKVDLLAAGDLHRATSYIEEQLRSELGISIRVHPVSSLPQYETLLNNFFERELLPHFEQARMHRNSSVARKIGSLRDSVIATLRSILEQKRRRGLAIPTDVRDLEHQLRRTTAEIEEQQTVLQQALFKLGEMPQEILDEAANSAVAWIQKNRKRHISSLELSEWLHDAVWMAMGHIIEDVRSASERAIFTLQTVAQEMDRTDVPSPDEVESLLRDVPRFELAALPQGIDLSRWMYVGSRFLHRKVRESLTQSVGSLLKRELYVYSRAVSQWSEQFGRKIVLLVNSYVSAYLLQLRQMATTSNDAADITQLERDLSLLETSAPEESAKATEAVEREA